MAQRQFARLTALAIATGTLVAVGTAPAGAAAIDSRVMADGAGSALKITINLPAALAGTPLGAKIEQTISMTDGSVSTLTGPLANSTAILGRGTTPVLSEALNRSTAAVLTGQREQTSSARELNAAGVKLSLLPLSSKVADPNADGVLAQSSSGVARLAVSGLALPDLAAVTAPVADVIGTAVGTVDSAGGTAAGTVGTVGATVNEAIDALNGATGGATTAPTAPVQAAIDDAVATLTETLTDLTGAVDLITSATSLVTLDAVTSDQVISRQGSTVTSEVSNVVKNLNVLNGLVKIKAIDSTATAVAGGKPGTAAATIDPAVLDVDLVNGALTAVIDEKGVNVGGTVGDALPAELEGKVNEAIAAVNGLLADAVGLDVKLAEGETAVAPDGTSARASVAATRVTLNPKVIADLLPQGQKFMTLELVSANAVAGSQLVAPPANPQAAPVNLPRTGGDEALAAVAFVLVGGALIARRRRATV